MQCRKVLHIAFFSKLSVHSIAHTDQAQLCYKGVSDGSQQGQGHIQ